MGTGSAGHAQERVDDDLAAIVRSSADAIIGKSLDGIITSWNAGAERLYGYTAAEAVGHSVSMLIPDDSMNELPTIMSRLRAGREVGAYETRRRRKDGSIVTVSLVVSPILDVDGNVVGASAIARDVSEARRVAERTRRLLEVTAGLAGAVTVDDVVRIGVELAIRAAGADAAVLVLLGPDGESARLAGSMGYDDAFVAKWDAWPLSDQTPVNDAVREGRLIALESVEDIETLYPEMARQRLEDTSAAVAVPLATEGPAFGALGLRFTRPRRFTTEDRDELRALGGQCAIALERARLFTAERDARERLTFLAEAGIALAASLDVDTLLTTVARMSVPRLADWCGITLVHDDRTVRRVGFHHVDPAKAEAGRSWWEDAPFPAERDRGAPNVVRTGHVELTRSIALDALERFADPSEVALLRELGLSSSMVVPLVARGRTLGAVTFVMGPSGRAYTERELELAEDLCRRAAVAVDNARLFAERLHVTRRLQESLLPLLLPDIPGVELAARYVAAAGTEVGGDFYDAFSLGDAWALVIGDVCGKGADAAGVTALARYTLRALAPRASRPDDVLVEVNDALVRQNVTDERFLTMAYGVLQPAAGGGDGVRARLTIALAGHPPAVVLRAADGSVERAGAAGTLLGVFSTVSLSTTTLDLFAGDTVVLFTDGVTEAHGAEGLFGDERLHEVIGSLAGRTADDVAGGIADAVESYRAGHGIADDMAVLVLRIAD